MKDIKLDIRVPSKTPNIPIYLTSTIEIIILAILIIILALKDMKINKLKDKIERLESSNLTLKRVMADEGLIPIKYVK